MSTKQTKAYNAFSRMTKANGSANKLLKMATVSGLDCIIVVRNPLGTFGGVKVFATDSVGEECSMWPEYIEYVRTFLEFAKVEAAARNLPITKTSMREILQQAKSHLADAKV